MFVFRPRATKRRGKARAVQSKVFDPNEAYREAQRRQAEQRRLNKLMIRQQNQRKKKSESRSKLIRTPKKRYIIIICLDIIIHYSYY